MTDNPNLPARAGSVILAKHNDAKATWVLHTSGAWNSSTGGVMNPFRLKDHFDAHGVSFEVILDVPVDIVLPEKPGSLIRVGAETVSARWMLTSPAVWVSEAFRTNSTAAMKAWIADNGFDVEVIA